MTPAPLNITKPALWWRNHDSPAKLVINQGGTSSGKTWNIMDLLLHIAVKTPNAVITVCGQDVPNLKSGVYRDARRILAETPYLAPCFTENKTDRLLLCPNGAVVEFKSYKDEQDAKSGKRDYLFVNEANGIPYTIFWQLYIRTKCKAFIDYNPTAHFWAHDLIGTPGVELLISDHRHNHYLTAEQHARIEGISDPELWRVYARGLTGKIRELVYSGWRLCDTMPDTPRRWVGLDFGFTNDPTAAVLVALQGGELWIDLLLYDKGLTNPEIAARLREAGVDTLDIIADSAEPKSIAELRSAGLKVEPAQKGADSIRAGIQALQRYRLNVTRRSTPLIKELQSYKWRVDASGNTLNTPTDIFNHALDAARYVALNRLIAHREAKGAVRSNAKPYIPDDLAWRNAENFNPLKQQLRNDIRRGRHDEHQGGRHPSR